jgi:hypothetical protein
MKQIYCPANNHFVKGDPPNKTSIADHGRCQECQKLWQTHDLPEQQEQEEPIS